MFSLIWMPFSIIRKSFHTSCHALWTEPNPAFPMLRVVGPWMPSGIRQNHLTSHFSCGKAHAILWFDPLLPFFSHSISFSQPFFFSLKCESIVWTVSTTPSSSDHVCFVWWQIASQRWNSVSFSMSMVNDAHRLFGTGCASCVSFGCIFKQFCTFQLHGCQIC